MSTLNRLNAPTRFLALTLLAVTLGCAGSRQAGGQSAPDLLYVANQGGATVSVIDIESQELVATVDLQEFGFSETAKPHHIAVEPDGSHWYVSLIGESRVVKFTRDNEMVASVEFETPGMLVLDPDTEDLFVARSMTAVNPPARVGVIQRNDMSSVEEIDIFFPRPHALTLTDDGATVYTASLAENKIMAIDVESEETTLTTLNGANRSLVQFAISPDGRTMVAGGHIDGKFAFFDISDRANPTLVQDLPVNAGPWHPVFTPDGRFVYFGNKMADTITVLDVESKSVMKIIEGRSVAQPHGSAVSADGRFVFISNQNGNGAWTPSSGNPADGTGNVVVIDTSTNAIVKTIEVGTNPSGMGTRPR